MDPQPTPQTPSTPPIPHTKIEDYLFSILHGTGKARVWLLLILLGIVASLYPIYSVFTWGLPVVSKLEENVKKIIEEVVPEELTVTIKDGHASTNVTEPYYLTVSSQTLGTFLPEEESDTMPVAKMRILAIDTNGSAENLEKYQSQALLTETSFVYYDDEDVKIQSLKDAPDMKINREFLNAKVAEINKDNRVVNLLTILLYASPLFIFLGLLVYYLVEVLTGAFLIWIINKILQTKIPFGRLFKLTGVLYLFPALFLMVLKFIPGLSVFYMWFYTALDVAMLSTAYVLLKNYKTIYHE